MNRASYFLARGATTTGSTSTTYLPSGMTGVGNDSAFRIWYRAMNYYFTTATDYAAARQALITASRDRFGPDSAEERAVWSAMRGINVGPAWTAAIERESMKYSAARSGLTTQEWTKSITADEFAALRRIVEEENLLVALTVPPGITLDPCNHAGMVVTMTKDGIPREFPISGAGVCDTSTSKSLLRLFDFMDSLARKYGPAS
ncbi:M4 family metallopeptidase [Massilia sp. RP-1-19]|uniref:M4 family metallopeptidase n=1 Tax=Massilia polaris TaxID=2728846 RepID=A0A848HJI9_9BURK|nr:M4 family metallopeptidase [Massilia polaris]NML62016.1 M4 family metallopeptidase [Massilia polaris]